MSSSEGRFRDIGLLLLRVGVGLMFVGHGWPKLAGGAEKWASLGKVMKHVGIEFWPTLWGFLAAAAETGGGVLLAVGLLFRPACVGLALTMVVAAAMHLSKGDGIMGSSHAIESGVLFVALLLIGPGRFALAARFRPG